LQEGREQGREEGLKEGKEEILAKLRNKGFTDKEIEELLN
ncbi:MAG TPA: flagellar assembly protein H, partial [Firmicutes bacterium]|nr:flagellar assembly protein H [Bacillota bacterium]